MPIIETPHWMQHYQNALPAPSPEPTPYQKRLDRIAQLEARMLSLIADSDLPRAAELAQCILALKAKS